MTYYKIYAIILSMRYCSALNIQNYLLLEEKHAATRERITGTRTKTLKGFIDDRREFEFRVFDAGAKDVTAERGYGYCDARKRGRGD